MKRLLLLKCFLLICFFAGAKTIIVSNTKELSDADKNAAPGDIIILKNGIWQDAVIELKSSGTKEQPVYFKAETPGKVIISGHSRLEIGGTYIIVEGLLFTNGYAGDNAVITFRSDKDHLANYCRVTQCAIEDYNNPKRMDENYWVAFYGKNNRLDHCSFRGKKNIGVLLAVILDDDRSRENFHQIDHNYFGKRIPLASNGGEIIRVGVSQHCQYNSNTQIRDNFFEHCDGETEVVSIKSCSNHVEENVFKECQGSVVLRHGDNNLVARNYFIGNDKPATGGVRVINKGQMVFDNIFYKCRGTGFRSPLVVMNGIPNSPAFRYVQVKNAEILNNTFYECAPLSFCEGSDTERTLPPENVRFAYNKFYNTRDSSVYRVYDNMDGFWFNRNTVSKGNRQNLPEGFLKAVVPARKNNSNAAGYSPGSPSVDYTTVAEQLASANTGASWFDKREVKPPPLLRVVKCATTEDIYQQLGSPQPVSILLTDSDYQLDKPFMISKYVQLSAEKSRTIRFHCKDMAAVFVIGGNGNLVLQQISADGTATGARYFIASDNEHGSDHYNLSLLSCRFEGFSRDNGCEAIFFAHKYRVADSIVIRQNSWTNNNTDGIIMNEEKDNKGYYNAEHIIITGNSFNKQDGVLLDLYRGGNDESTLGPDLLISNNKLSNCSSPGGAALIHLFGIQRTRVENNYFSNCNTGKALILYEDLVRADHSFRKNVLAGSGEVKEDKFVTMNENRIE